MTTAMTARNVYAMQSVATASPAKLLTMLYDRLVRDILVAEKALHEQQLAAASEQLLHAQQIVLELQASLDPDKWDGAAGLSALYAFLYQELVAANVGKDPAKARACYDLVEPLRQAWHEAARLMVAQS